MSNELANTGKILIYQNEKGDTKIDVYFTEETIWMTQRTMAELYQTTPQNITTHIKNIYEDGELDMDSTCKDYLQVQSEGDREVQRARKFYNLDMILAVGYRVRSNVGIHFRKWASGVLTEYMKKGFVLNDERLRNPKEFGADYFDELLERIRDIRASEKRLYQKVKDIFALSVDYDSRSDVAQNFFKSVQNKLEYAATGHTAPEIIASRADATKDNMGLTAFKGAKVRKSDVTVAKNYMDREEISTLNLIVNMYLDYAELQAKQHHEMHMADWEEKLNQFLQFNGREVLQNFGTVKREVAEALAYAEYEKYDAHRRELEAADLDELTEGVRKLKQRNE
ncbi:MAG: virulence RhuM family protein [Candidatus Limivicinus sp.]|nr:virulence RhuM family protein [Candidatus Limivicinus sp.]